MENIDREITRLTLCQIVETINDNEKTEEESLRTNFNLLPSTRSQIASVIKL